MKASEELCCVCGRPSVMRAFDGTGWCIEHGLDWANFCRHHRGEFAGLSDAFESWLSEAKAKEAEEQCAKAPPLLHERR